MFSMSARAAVRSLALFACLLPLLLYGANASAEMRATRTFTPPTIDGLLEDKAWETAVPFEGFIQRIPLEALPPTERTVLRVLYDDEAIYVAFQCDQRNAPVIARLNRRDREPTSDYVVMDIDPDQDGLSAFHFQVSAAGVQVDALHYDDTEISPEWDEVWQAETTVTPQGWAAEMRIPLRALRFPKKPVQTWGYHVERKVYAIGEIMEAPLLSRTQAAQVSRYGRMEGLDNLVRGKTFELRPFVLGRLRHRDATEDAIGSGTDFGGSAGLDLKWHASEDFVVDAAILPDFAQVEADQEVLNLTNFEVEYPEKRPFFLEGFELFRTPMVLVYTRRIGAAVPSPILRTDMPYSEQLRYSPEPSTLWGALKGTGKLGDSLQLGILGAVTGPADAEISSQQAIVNRRVDPLSIYHVLRLRYDFAPQTFLGMIATATHRLENGGYPAMSMSSPSQLCPAGDTATSGGRCFHDAYTFGIDGNWRSASGDYLLLAQGIASLLTGGPPRLLPDGTVIVSGDMAPGGVINFLKDGGKHFTWEVSYDVWGRKLDYSDLGFMQRQNIHHVYANVEFRTIDPWWKTLETHTMVEFFDRYSLDGLPLGQRGFNPSTFWLFSNFSEAYLEFPVYFNYFDDREIGNGTALERAVRAGINAEYQTDARKDVVGEIRSETAWYGSGFSQTLTGILKVRPFSRLDLELLPTGFFTRGEPRYIGTNNGDLLFGRLTAKSVGTTLRATFTFTPRLTLQAYAQLFLASRHYSDFLTPGNLPAGSRVPLDSLRPTGAPPSSDNPDRFEGAFNMNLVLRWEYLPGSTLFVVYTHAQSPYTMFPTSGTALPATGGLMPAAGLDLTRTLTGPSSDVFVLKLSYWWG